MDRLRHAPPIRSLALVSAQAFTLVNFRDTLIAALVARGVRVFALAPDHDGRTRQRLRELGAEPVDYVLSRTGINPLRDLRATLGLARLLRRLSVDVSFGYAAKPATYGTVAAALAGVPRRYAMIEGLGYVFTAGAGRERLRRRALRAVVKLLYRLCLKGADKVFFLNDDDIAEFVAEKLVGPQKVVKLGGIGIDLDAWPARPAVTAPVTFVMAARLLREKGVLEFAEAAAKVKALHPGARFVLLGALDENPGALSTAEIERFVAAGVLEWPGHVKVRPWLAQASVCVLPTYYREGVPRGLQEAMAMGRPLITTDTPGCRDTVEEGRNGFLVPPRDAAALARAMLRFVNEPALIAPMGRESRLMAEERFDAARADRLLCDTVLGDGAGAPA